MGGDLSWSCTLARACVRGTIGHRIILKCVNVLRLEVTSRRRKRNKRVKSGGRDAHTALRSQSNATSLKAMLKAQAQRHGTHDMTASANSQHSSKQGIDLARQLLLNSVPTVHALTTLADASDDHRRAVGYGDLDDARRDAALWVDHVDCSRTERCVMAARSRHAHGRVGSGTRGDD